MKIQNRIISNSAWIISEKFISIFGLIFITSYMAKYIGPDNFGKITFTSSLFLFVQTIAWFGTESILFKRLSINASSGLYLSFSSKIIRVAIYLISSTFILTYLWYMTDLTTFVYGLGNFVASYFIINDIYSIYNNSQLKSYINTFANIIGTVLALLVRFILVHYESNVNSMIIPIVILAVIPYLIKKSYFIKTSGHIYNYTKATNKRNKSRYNKYLIQAGSALVISTLSITLYTQIANILLARLASFRELGIYNVGITLGGAWGFISVALVTSFFSEIYSSKSFRLDLAYLKRLHLIIFLVSIVVLCIVLLLGKWFISVIYGEDFVTASSIVPLTVIATMLSGFGTIANRYLIKENGYKYISIKAVVVAAISIPAYSLLIMQYGIMGAAYGFILVELLSLTLANYFFKDGLILKIHKSILINHKL